MKNNGKLSSTGLSRIPHREDTAQIVANIPAYVKEALVEVAHERGRTLSAHLYLVLRIAVKEGMHLLHDELLEADEILDIRHKEALKIARAPKGKKSGRKRVQTLGSIMGNPDEYARSWTGSFEGFLCPAVETQPQTNEKDDGNEGWD